MHIAFLDALDPMSTIREATMICPQKTRATDKTVIPFRIRSDVRRKDCRSYISAVDPRFRDTAKAENTDRLRRRY